MTRFQQFSLLVLLSLAIPVFALGASEIKQVAPDEKPETISVVPSSIIGSTSDVMAPSVELRKRIELLESINQQVSSRWNATSAIIAMLTLIVGIVTILVAGVAVYASFDYKRKLNDVSREMQRVADDYSIKLSQLFEQEKSAMDARYAEQIEEVQKRLEKVEETSSIVKQQESERLTKKLVELQMNRAAAREAKMAGSVKIDYGSAYHPLLATGISMPGMGVMIPQRPPRYHRCSKSECRWGFKLTGYQEPETSPISGSKNDDGLVECPKCGNVDPI